KGLLCLRKYFRWIASHAGSGSTRSSIHFLLQLPRFTAMLASTLQEAILHKKINRQMKSHMKAPLTHVKPEYHEQEEFQNRLRKLHEIRSLGINPYPHAYKATAEAKSLHEKYPAGTLGHSEDAEKGSTPSAAISGRLVLFRAMGKNAF